MDTSNSQTQHVPAEPLNGQQNPPSVTVPIAAPVDAKPIVEPEEPMSGPGKEFSPASDTNAKKDYVIPSQPEVSLTKELKEAGVSPAPNIDRPQISTEPAKASPVVLAKESVPVQTQPTGNVKIPMEEGKAVEVVKLSKPIESIRWLATLIIEQAKKAHKRLKS